MPRGTNSSHTVSKQGDKVRRDLIELLYNMQVAEGDSSTYFCCPDLSRFKSSKRHATLRPTPRSTPRCPSISSTKVRGNCLLAALALYGFMVTPVSACPNIPRNAVSSRLYHTNLICSVLHQGHRSAHAGYRVSHLAWPSVRALDMNVSIVVRHQLCINQANRSTGRRRLG